MYLRTKLLFASLLAAAGGALALSSVAAAAETCNDTAAPGGWTMHTCLSWEGDAGGNLAGATPLIQATAQFSGGTGKAPRVQRMIFTLTGQGDPENRLLMDFAKPYRFQLPTSAYKGGTWTLGVKAAISNKSSVTGELVSQSVTFAGSEQSFDGKFTPTNGTNPAAGKPFVVAAVGDGAGGEAAAKGVINQISGWNPNLFLYLGDVYDVGTQAEYYNWYQRDPDDGLQWGRFRSITDPTIGNHDSFYRKGWGYFDYYWGLDKTKPASHRYSVNTPNGWHIVSLDSTRSYLGPKGGTANATEQKNWLNADLAANESKCTVVIFHHPLYDVGPEFKSDDPLRLKPIWQILAAHHVDIVLNGHDHDYQRWVRQDENGNATSDGPAEFVVGTGGHGIQAVTKSSAHLAKVISDKGAFGALRLVLNRYGANFEFRRSNGDVVADAGAVGCRDNPAPPDTTPPTAPRGLRASASRPTKVRLTWKDATDVGGVGIKRYDVFRNGKLRGRTAKPTFVDTTRGGSHYRYRIRAVDFSNNTRMSGVLRVVLGTKKGNRLRGSSAADFIFGFGGGDRLVGRRGADHLFGGGGADTLVGGGGRDVMSGGSGRDLFLARDGIRDVIFGGPGRDRGRIDRHRDRVHSLEVRLR